MRVGVLIALLVAVAIVVVGVLHDVATCANPAHVVRTERGTDLAIYTIEHEGCEYVVVNAAYNSTGGTSVAHKGNCKFCAERRGTSVERP